MSDKRKKFGKIYDQYINKIYRFVYLKVNSEEVAKDLSSETFIRGWEMFQREPIDNAQACLYRIARNLVIDHYRQKGRTQFVSVDDLPIVDHTADLEERAVITSDIDLIKVKLADLKDDYQNVIIWHYLDDLPIRETAKLLDKSEDATRVLLHRALESLKSRIKSA